MNNRKLKVLGGMTPNEVISPFSDIKTRPILKKVNETLSKNRINRDVFKENSLVFIGIPKGVNDKGYDLQRGSIKRVKSINKDQFPYTYTLEDIDKSNTLPRNYYRNELRKAPALRSIPKEIDKIYDSRRKNKRKEYLVSFYGSK